MALCRFMTLISSDLFEAKILALTLPCIICYICLFRQIPEITTTWGDQCLAMAVSQTQKSSDNLATCLLEINKLLLVIL